MLPHTIAPLVGAVAWAVPCAVLAPVALPLGAAIAAAGLVWAACGRGPIRHSGLAALPALLAAMSAPDAPPPTARPGPVTVAGTVHDVVRAPLTGQCFVQVGERPGVRLWFDGDVDALPGDTLRVVADLPAAAPPGQPITLRAVTGTAAVAPGPPSLRRAAAALRRALERELLRLVPGEEGAMLATLVLGRATLPDRDLVRAHRATGLSHLLAVSGAHAAMLALLLGLSSRGRRLGASGLRTGAVLGILFVYAAVAGGEPPVLRAVIAFALASLGARVGRPFGMAAGLLAPAVVTCVVEPSALTGPSFLLSYAAVIGLSLSLRRGPARGTAPAWLADALRASWWAMLLTAPLTLWFFGQLAPWTVVLTPLCAPLVAALLLLGLVASTIGLGAPGIAALFALPLRGLAATYAGIVHAADLLPGTPVPALGVPPIGAVLLCAALAVAAICWRPGRTTVAGAAIAAAALWFVPLQPAERPGFRLLAVGHGQAALATTAAGQRIAIDCGSQQHALVAARALVAALPRRQLDVLVVTHADADHANGIEALLERVRVRAAIVPPELVTSAAGVALRRHGAELLVAEPGTRLRPLADLNVFAPALPPDSSANDRSLWVSLRAGDVSVLLCGDAEAAGVAAALADGFAAPCDVLVLPHHGRANANASPLLLRTRPRACLVSASAADGETALGPLARAAGAELWVTGWHGHLTVDGAATTIAGSLGPRRLWPRSR